VSKSRLGYGPLVSALGSVLLAVPFFLPWYDVSITATGLTAAKQLGSQVVTQYGNANLQTEWGAVQASFNGLAGHDLATVSAHQALHTINVVLLVLAGIAILLALRPLAGSDSVLPDVTPGWIAVLGALAAALVLNRIVEPPLPDNGFVTLSLHVGAWLALVSAVAMVAGGLWQPGSARTQGASQVDLDRAWSGLSGWTPPS
jgi:hypothetical protein